MILEFQRIILLSVDLSKYIAYVIMQTDNTKDPDDCQGL